MKINEDEELLINIDDFAKLIHSACDDYEGISGQIKRF